MTGSHPHPSAQRAQTGPVFAPQPPAMSIGDIYYALFRHKWKIVICAILGMGAAAFYYKSNPPAYRSVASLFVRFVISEGKSVGPAPGDATTKSPDQRGETIMGSELQILTSLDLARQAAAVVGPERILAAVGGGNDLVSAAGMVQRGLRVEIPQRSSVIQVSFRHPDREIVQPVLREVVEQYFKMHTMIHRSVGMMDNFLAQETDQMRARLAQTEEELRRAIAQAGVISLEDAKANYSVQVARLQQEIFTAQAEIAERAGALAALKIDTSAPTTDLGEDSSDVTRAQIEQYRTARTRVDFLRRREQELLVQFTPESSRVREVRDQLATAENEVRAIEADQPAFTRLAPASSTTTNGRSPGGLDVEAEKSRLVSLESRVKALTAQREQIRAEAAALDLREVGIRELRRRQQLEEANYRLFSASLEQMRINEAMGTGKVSNITPVQTPSPPFADSTTRNKFSAILALGGMGIGLAWAFFIELVLDRSVRRPHDIERLGRYPLFITIPRLKAKQLLAGGKANTTALAMLENNNGSPAIWEATHALHAYHETLRDRMISFFDARGLTHKPKLVAVTSIGTDAGATTTAAGLASSLSRTGDGNVLLVDMTPGQSSAHHFQHGQPVRGLEETLEAGGERVQVQDNLYLAGGAKSDELARALPRQFTRLMPKLRASDFDYIIFDMPAISQISITPRLAEYMDMVFMVVESEKTSRESVQRAAEMLTETGATVGVVLNKNRSYVPSRLEPVALS